MTKPLPTWVVTEDEVAAIVLHHRSDGLTGEEIVAEVDGPQWCEPGVMLVEPALDGVSLAILFFGAVHHTIDVANIIYLYPMRGIMMHCNYPGQFITRS